MGRPDQLIKRIFREEAAAATGQRVRFEVPSEIATGSLAPDGRVTLAVAPSAVAALPAPWCHLRDEATVDFKMPGDHLGRVALARVEFRRHARWVTRLEAPPPPNDDTLADTDDADPRDVATWVVAPHRPRWLDRDVLRETLTVTSAGAGRWRLGPRDHDVLWIAANELPLRAELLPFLVVRSGRALLEFALWAAAARGPDWIAGVLQELPMATELLEQIPHVPTDPDEQRRLHNELLRRWLQQVPEAADELVLGPLLHLFERRLKRKLDMTEQAVLRRRFTTLGADRLGDVVLDLSTDALARWLTEPDAA